MLVALRGVHILAGCLALGFGVAALVVTKGDARHRLLGRWFVAVGRVVVVSALVSAVSGVVAVDQRLGGGLSAAERAEARDVVPVFFSLLGVLGLLAAFDLERGVASIRQSSVAHLRWIAVLCGVVGLAVSGWGLMRVIDGRGGVSWFAVVVGLFGVETAVRHGRGWRSDDAPVVSHATAMIDAMFGFIAAFTLFGAGRLLSFDLFAGDVRIIVTVAVVVLAGNVLSRWWRARIERSAGVARYSAPESAAGTTSG